MKTPTPRSRLPALAGALLLALVASGCSNPVQGDHEEHPIGFVVSDAQGVPVATATADAVTGRISVPLGAARTFTVVAVSEDGDPIAIDGHELGLQLQQLPAHADFAFGAANRIVVSGLEAASGTVRIVLMHHGHEEVARDVPVVVDSDDADPT